MQWTYDDDDTHSSFCSINSNIVCAHSYRILVCTQGKWSRNCLLLWWMGLRWTWKNLWEIECEMRTGEYERCIEINLTMIRIDANIWLEKRMHSDASVRRWMRWHFSMTASEWSVCSFVYTFVLVNENMELNFVLLCFASFFSFGEGKSTLLSQTGTLHTICTREWLLKNADESDCVETVHGNKKMQSKRQQTEKPPNHKINYSTVHIHSTLSMHKIVIFHCFISSQKLHFQRSNIWFLINSHCDRVRSSTIVYNCHHTCSHTSSSHTQQTHALTHNYSLFTKFDYARTHNVYAMCSVQYR